MKQKPVSGMEPSIRSVRVARVLGAMALLDESDREDVLHR